MITESMTIQLLHVFPSALTITEQWGKSGQHFDAFSAVEGWLTGFAMAALIISLILVIFQSANYKRSLDNFRRQIDGLTTHIEELRQQIVEMDQQAPAQASEQKLTEEPEELVTIQKS